MILERKLVLSVIHIQIFLECLFIKRFSCWRLRCHIRKNDFISPEFFRSSLVCIFFPSLVVTYIVGTLIPNYIIIQFVILLPSSPHQLMLKSFLGQTVLISVGFYYFPIIDESLDFRKETLCQTECLIIKYNQLYGHIDIITH